MVCGGFSMRINRGIHIIIICFCLSNFLRCSPPIPSASSVQQQNEQPPSSRDSIFELFENLADTAPSLYVTNPDSFLNSYRLHPQTVEQQEIYAYGLLYMAYGLREYGDNYSSIKYYENALNFIQQHQVENLDRELYIFKPLAALYTSIDDNQKSINLLERVLSELPEDNQVERIGFANNLATAYFYNNESLKATNLLLENIAKPAPPLSKALLYNSLSSIYKGNQDIANSIRYNRLALQTFQRNKLHGDTLVWYISALGQYAELHHHIESAKEAMSILNQNFSNAQYRTKAKLQQTIAELLYKNNDFKTAKKHFGDVISIFTYALNEKYVLDYTYTQALVGLAQCYRHLEQPDSALHYFQWAIENDFRTQQLITSKRNQLSNNVWNREIIEEMLALVNLQLQYRKDDQGLIATLLWCIELSKGRPLINEINRSANWDNASPEIKEAIQYIRNLYQKLGQTDQVKEKQRLQKQIQQTIVDFQLSERYFETLRYIPEKTAFLAELNHGKKDYFSYFVHSDGRVSLIGYIGTKYVYHQITDSLFFLKLQQFKEAYFGDSPHNYNLNPSLYQQQAYYFARLLLPDIDKAGRNIHLSLDGSLYGLPFDALYDEDKTLLVNTHNFAYLNSFILYDLIKAPAAEETEIALLYRSEFPNPLPNLNFVHEEVDNISRKFYGYKIAPEHQQDSTIVQQFSSKRAIHIASHTLLDSTENPILYLQQPISTEQLRFYHIYSPMIFLSACNTGSGRSLPSEGMESIQRVFLGKGVPSVISTYWFANDEAMLRLTTLFYQELSDCRQPAEALANAKRKFLQTASVEQQNPWYWSNINYAGVDNEIGLRKNSNLSVILLVFLFFMIMLITLLIRYLRVLSRVGRRRPENRQ